MFKRYKIHWRIIGTHQAGTMKEGTKYTLEGAVRKCKLWNLIDKQNREFYPVKRNWRGVWTRVKGY